MQVVTLEIAQSISFSGLNYQFEPPKESVYQLDYPWLDLENMQSEGILQLFSKTFTLSETKFLETFHAKRSIDHAFKYKMMRDCSDEKLLQKHWNHFVWGK